MRTRGWIYVLTNKAMPGLVKIGFSTKDPIFRVEELSGTGLPFAFDLEYDALVNEPRDVEQKVHKRLAEQREAKEFFRTDVPRAVATIREILTEDGKPVISEQVRQVPYADKLSLQLSPTKIRTCQKCGESVSPSARRCPQCFILLNRSCQKCGQTVTASTRRCPSCFTRCN